MDLDATLRALIATPDGYLFDFAGGDARILPMDRAAYARSIFLDERIAADVAGGMRVPIDALAAAAAGLPTHGLRWIFHIALCGSTLLARAIDREERALVLREPVPLAQISRAAAEGGDDAAERAARLKLCVALLARRYRPDAPVVVKDAPINLMLEQLQALDPAAPAILLYHRLEDYLCATLRSPEHRAWAVAMTDARADGLAQWCGPIGDPDPVLRATALWLAQLRQFEAATRFWAGAHSLDAEQFFAEPRATLAAVHQLFGIATSPDEIDAIVAGDLFNHYSKSPDLAFSNANRVRRRTVLRVALTPEITRAHAWLEARLEDYPLDPQLARPLAGTTAAALY
ncbi:MULTISPECIES: hypothetical protein [unclassified Sphingomonas]|uniref:hypothetical protein n=1 Tax=unclassified Sphingomonas TaxID=196159 RepID=UPI0008372A8E|nr:MULTISPECIES: hypothetical protein [unclassified Sphingomonas]